MRVCIAAVVVSNARRAFDREYDYAVPDGLAGRARPGMRAFAPFGPRNAARVVIIVSVRWAGGEQPAQGERAGWGGELKALLEIPDSEPLLDGRDFALAAHMRDKCMCTWFEALSCMLPKGWDRKGDSAAGRFVRGVRLAVGPAEAQNAIDAYKVNRVQHIRVLEYMLAAGGGRGGPQAPEPSDQAPVASAQVPKPSDQAPRQSSAAGAAGDPVSGAAGDPAPDVAGGLISARSDPAHCQSGSASGASDQTPEPSAQVPEPSDQAPAASGPAPGQAGMHAGALAVARVAAPFVAPFAARVAVPVRDVAAGAGVTAAVVRTLVRNGWLEEAALPAEGRRPGRSRPYAANPAPAPSAEQKLVLARASERLASREFYEILLHGVTGSGKTEVYMQLAAQALEMGRQAIVLVPEISLTPQMADRFRGRFGGLVAIFHSRLSDGERGDEWRRVRSGGASIAVGARSAVFAPFRDIGLIVVDEEHESSYKSEMSPRYHAGDIARFRCRDHGAVLVYGSATPSVDTYYLAEQGRIELLEMASRANSSSLPQVSVTDMRDELRGGNRSMFGRPLAEAIRENLSAGMQSIIFMNRRGYASFMLCRDCGYIVTCRECSVSYTYHQDRDRLVCHYCGLTAPVPRQCPACGGGNVRQFGMGTERVEEEMRRAFPGCSVLRMDRDTTAGKDGHAKVLDEFAKKKTDILIGTQMIAKGHDFPNVTLVGVLAADSILNFNDYRAAERAFQLLTQVSGRSGRGGAPGRVIIQTYNPDHYSVRMAREHDYKGFYRQEIIARRELLYPPFRAIGAILATGPDDAQTRQAIEGLCRRIGEIGAARGDAGLSMLAPMRPPIARIREKFRWRCIVKHPDAEALEGLLREALDDYGGGGRGG
ncbi:MAG: primosomal protein N', partial [Clostridiales bacterium]|nr:primosomal protein N' [Clostridiales bacterium]